MSKTYIKPYYPEIREEYLKETPDKKDVEARVKALDHKSGLRECAWVLYYYHVVNNGKGCPPRVLQLFLQETMKPCLARLSKKWREFMVGSESYIELKRSGSVKIPQLIESIAEFEMHLRYLPSDKQKIHVNLCVAIRIFLDYQDQWALAAAEKKQLESFSVFMELMQEIEKNRIHLASRTLSSVLGNIQCFLLEVVWPACKMLYPPEVNKKRHNPTAFKTFTAECLPLNIFICNLLESV